MEPPAGVNLTTSGQVCRVPSGIPPAIGNPERDFRFDLSAYREGMYWMNIPLEGMRSRTLRMVMAKAVGSSACRY